MQSWSLFVFRDTLTIGSGFTVPPIFANYLYNNKIIENKKTATTVAQLSVPVGFQLILTPIHLLALDFYNNKISKMVNRFNNVANSYVESTTIRWGRVIAAYGIAGIINTDFRNLLREKYLPTKYHPKK